MPDNVSITPGSGANIATDDVAGVQFQRVKLALGIDGAYDGDVSSSLPMPVSGPLTDTQLRASAVPVSGTVTATGPLTDTQLRATPVPVSGTVTANTGLTQPLTDTQLRAAAVPVSAASLPLPTGAATETTLAALNTKIPASPATEGGNLATLVARTPAVGQATMAASSPVVIASDQSTLSVNQAGQSATGSPGALNAAVTLSLLGATGFAVDVRGTFVATILIEGTVDGTNFITLSVLPIGAGLNIAQVASITAPGAWWGNANGLQQVRARISAYTSGTATVVIRAMQAAGMVFNVPAGQTTQAVSGTVTANIGTGSIAAGTNAIGDVGIQVRANATGAASVANVLSPATPAGQVVKASAGRLLGGTVTNTNAAARFLKVFNATSITPGTTSATFELALPPNQPVPLNVPAAGLAFGTGIVIMVTAAQGLTNNGAVTGNEVTGFVAFA